MAKCIVLHTSKVYSEDALPLLRELLGQKPTLIAVVGVDCANWEEAVDCLCIESKTDAEKSEVFCCTTSHADEILAEVFSFAEQWCQLGGWPGDVEVIEA